jgi:hypothetical protein
MSSEKVGPIPDQSCLAHAKSDSKSWRSAFPLMIMQDDQCTVPHINKSFRTIPFLDRESKACSRDCDFPRSGQSQETH